MQNLNELMTITAEECAELTQVCMKIVRFGMNNEGIPKKQWLTEEAGDVYCMISMLVENGLLTWEELEERANHKKNKLKEWSNLYDES